MKHRSNSTNITNWRQGAHSSWAFQHVREILPTAAIPGAAKSPMSPSESNLDMGDLKLSGPKGNWNIDELHQQSFTDSFLVLHKGQVVHRWHASHVEASLPHIVFSVSKSITATVCGILQSRGVIDSNARVTDYLPDAKNSVYADCTVQHVLDMSVAINFDENYAEPEGDYLNYRKASGWNAVDQNNPGPDLESYLYTLQKLDEPHGEVFRYRSPNSDLLGLIVERAAKKPFASVVSDLLWKPMGAQSEGYVSLDRAGMARSAGGICTTSDDLARLGQLILDKGRALDGTQVLSEEWINDTWNNGNHSAWEKGGSAYMLPQGRYRNKWYQSGDDENAMWALGIHGQFLYINPNRSVVIVKQSCQPQPIDGPGDMAVMASIVQIAKAI